MRKGAPHRGQRGVVSSGAAAAVSEPADSGWAAGGAGVVPSNSRQRASFSWRRPLAVMP